MPRFPDAGRVPALAAALLLAGCGGDSLPVLGAATPASYNGSCADLRGASARRPTPASAPSPPWPPAR